MPTITNLTGGVFDFPCLRLHGNETAAISLAQYTEDEGFRQQLNHLYDNGKVSVSGIDGFPIGTAEEDEETASGGAENGGSVPAQGYYPFGVSATTVPHGSFANLPWTAQAGGLPNSADVLDLAVPYRPAVVESGWHTLTVEVIWPTVAATGPYGWYLYLDWDSLDDGPGYGSVFTAEEVAQGYGPPSTLTTRAYLTAGMKIEVQAWQNTAADATAQVWGIVARG